MGDGHLKCSKQSYYPIIEILTEDFTELTEIFTGWTNNNRQRPNRQPVTVAILYDRNIGLFLLKHGYLDKSVNSPYSILSTIPTYLHNYFWRGYSDADGCFYINEKYYLYQYVICGNYEQSWKELEMLCATLKIPFKIRRVVTKNKNRYSQFRIIGKDNVTRMGDYLYTGETFGLVRKYDKFCIIRNKCVDKNL